MSSHISLQIAKKYIYIYLFIYFFAQKIYIYIFHQTALALTCPEVHPVLAEAAPQCLNHNHV
jgi:hypothetical protein